MPKHWLKKKWRDGGRIWRGRQRRQRAMKKETDKERKVRRTYRGREGEKDVRG